MKKLLKVTLVTGILLMGLGYGVFATICGTFRIHCGDGTGTNTVTCGNTRAEALAEAREVAEAFCN